MPPMNAQNMMLSPAATDLGLGDMLRNQTEETELERKKKLLLNKPDAFGAQIMGPATMSLFGTMGGFR